MKHIGEVEVIRETEDAMLVELADGSRRWLPKFAVIDPDAMLVDEDLLDDSCSMTDENGRVICGAKSKRSGKPCKRSPAAGRTRCKFHGGASTGARTPEGKAKAALSLRRLPFDALRSLHGLHIGARAQP